MSVNFLCRSIFFSTRIMNFYDIWKTNWTDEFCTQRSSSRAQLSLRREIFFVLTETIFFLICKVCLAREIHTEKNWYRFTRSIAFGSLFSHQYCKKIVSLIPSLLDRIRKSQVTQEKQSFHMHTLTFAKTYIK